MVNRHRMNPMWWPALIWLSICAQAAFAQEKPKDAPRREGQPPAQPREGAAPAPPREGEAPAEPPPKPDDLSARLIRKATAEGEEDLMSSIVRLMGEAARKVEVDFDPGADTQAVQQTIQTKLDEAIKAAASRQRTKQVAPPNPDRRRMPTAKRDTPPPKPQPRGQPQPSATSSSAETAQELRPGEPESGDLLDVRRGWGHLPKRERDEIIQGAGEGYLERYRAWVERYYRALQEKDQ